MRASALLRLLLWLLLAILALSASWGCVVQETGHLRYSASRFNDHIAQDLQPLLVPAEVETDLCYGLFLDGSVDPDGDLPRTGGLVSEIYPIAAADPSGPGNLVQAPCFFAGKTANGGDELHLSWEVIGTLDPEEGSELAKLVRPDYAEVGICTLSGPISRLMFEDPDEPLQMKGICADGEGELALTVNADPQMNKNIPNSCLWGAGPIVRLEAVLPTIPNPDGVCPALNPNPQPGLRCGSEHNTGTAVPVTVSGCIQNASEQLITGCALPCGITPKEDATYRVRIDPMNAINIPVAERWLRPNILMVDGARTIVRPMTVPPNMTDYVWHTEVQRPSGLEGPFRWAENFSPTVRVETVQIVSRDAQGGDEKVVPANGLTVVVPRAGQGAPAILSCTAKPSPNGPLFDMSTCTASTDVPGGFTSLTPTYYIANLHTDPPVSEPITWRAALPALASGRSAFIRFGLRAQTMGAALRVSSALRFGTVPDTEYRQGTVEIENVGGETMTVTELGLRPGFGDPQDFSIFAIGDPVPVPLPIEAKPDGDGVSLRLGDLTEAPILNIEEDSSGVHIRIGDPAATPGDPQRLTLYGHSTQLRGRILTREDEAAVFTPSAPSDPRPFALQGYLEKKPPFVMGPGERVKVAVEARPTAHGLRRAALRIRGVPDSNPNMTQTIESQLLIEVVSGPLLRHAPSSLYIQRHENGSESTHRKAVLFNAGHIDLNLQQIQVTGPSAARFLASTDRGLGPFVLPPGDYVDVRVEYLPECDGSYGTATSAVDHAATLLVTSNGGTASIPLAGSSEWFCRP